MIHCRWYQVYHFRNHCFWLNVSMHIMHNETSSLFQKHKVKSVWFSKKAILFVSLRFSYFFLRNHKRNAVESNPIKLKNSKITRTIVSDSHFLKISSAQLTTIIDTTTACTITPNTTNCIDPEFWMPLFSESLVFFSSAFVFLQHKRQVLQHPLFLSCMILTSHFVIPFLDYSETF